MAPASEDGLSARDFGLAPRLREHFGENPRQLPVVADQLESSDHPSLQVALDDFVAAPGRSHPHDRRTARALTPSWG